jgi:hypothetical protein
MNQGVSTRDSPYVHLTSYPQYVRTCVRPSGEGVLGRDKHASPYYVLAAGLWEGERTCAMHGYRSIQQCTSSNGEKGSENEKASPLVYVSRTDIGSSMMPTGNLQKASLAACNLDGWTLVSYLQVQVADNT